MKNCNECAHAQWKRTPTGRLHASGDGVCTWKYRAPKLPQSMFFIGYPQGEAPSPVGGCINRHGSLKDHCLQYKRNE